MSITFAQGAVASTGSATHSASASAIEPSVLSGGAFDDLSGSGGSGVGGAFPEENRIRHLLFGTLADVNGAIAHLHSLGYAEPNDWSRPLSTGRPNEVMVILTKRVGRGISFLEAMHPYRAHRLCLCARFHRLVYALLSIMQEFCKRLYFFKQLCWHFI